MRILVLTDRYPPFYVGGYEINCHQITEGLRARNHEVVVLTTTYGGEPEADDDHVRRLLSNKNQQVLGFWRRGARAVNQLAAFKHDYDVTRQLINKFKPDLVFVWHMLSTSLSPIFAAEDLGVQIVYRIGSKWLVDLQEDYSLETNPIKKISRLAKLGFRRFKEIRFKLAIMVSDSIKLYYQQAGFPVNDTVIIPNGVALASVSKSAERKTGAGGTVRLLIAGRLEQEKGSQVALQAIEYLVGSLGCENFSLDFIGKGTPSFEDQMKARVENGGLQKFVHFLGFLPREELHRRYQDYDILLFPSISWEGFGMSIIEAMSQGVPVIASDHVGGPSDIIQDGLNGLLVPPNDPAALANAIRALIISPAKRRQMSEEAIKTVLDKYSFESMLDRYEDYLKVCLNPAV